MSISELANIDIEKVSKEDLVDVSCFTFDNTIPHAERVDQIISLVKNPYCFRVGNLGVKLEFPEEAPSLQEILTNFLIRQKSGL